MSFSTSSSRLSRLLWEGSLLWYASTGLSCELRANLSLYTPFLHYYDIAYYQSELVDTLLSGREDLDSDLLHMRSLLKTLPVLGEMLYS